MGQPSGQWDSRNPRFRDIPRFIHWGGYAVDIPWNYLEESIQKYVEHYNFDMGESDFQRDHVWTFTQRVAYLEFKLRGGQSGGDILTNSPDWQRSGEGPMILVDGKQRLHAVLGFLKNATPAFGTYCKDFLDSMSLYKYSFRWHVNSLLTRREVLQWYLELNAGGTPHTKDEIAKVQDLLAKERS